jgi:hypothetical protein
VNSPRAISRPTSGISAEQARNARARAWAYVFDCWRKKDAAGMTSTHGDDTKGRSVDDFRADEASVPR